jgi:hypothetical protein
MGSGIPLSANFAERFTGISGQDGLLREDGKKVLAK